MTWDKGSWETKVAADPGHSQWYIDRFAGMAAAGADLVGEGRLVDALAPRNARILDAGCGPGRVGGYLHDRGHHVTGVDVDPTLVAEAQATHPGPRWIAANLADLSVPHLDPVGGEFFDVIVCAGNVLTFLAPSTRIPVLRGFAAHLTRRVGDRADQSERDDQSDRDERDDQSDRDDRGADGRAVVGFGAGRGYAFDDFFADVTSAGLRAEMTLSTWDVRPFDAARSDFLVAILTPAD